MLGPEERQRVPVERRAEVAELLNGLANRTSRCAFALDFEEGFVRTDLTLDTAGCTTPPSARAALRLRLPGRDVRGVLPPVVVSVAHQGVEAEAALEAFEVNVSQ